MRQPTLDEIESVPMDDAISAKIAAVFPRKPVRRSLWRRLPRWLRLAWIVVLAGWAAIGLIWLHQFGLL